MKQNYLIQAFNRGLVSRLGLARTDIDRLMLSASIQNNWMPRVLGGMMLRPGWRYTGGTDSNNKAYHAPFVYANDDTAILEFTDTTLRIKIDETPITRVAVSSVVTNGDMSAAGSWTDNDAAGATSSFSGGYMTLLGTSFNAARRTQQVSVAVGDRNKEHALRVIIDRGEVTLKVGSTSGDDDYVSAVTLTPGEYSIAFSPAGDFYIDLSSVTKYTSRVDSCVIESAGVISIDTEYVEADLGLIRYEQSGNVIYVACDGYKIYKVQRIDTGNLTYTKRSWGLVEYAPSDGPFRAINTESIRLTPSAISGDITVTSSSPVFKSSNVGSIYRVLSAGQSVSSSVSGEDQWTNAVRVTGVGVAPRTITITRSGTWTATVTVQRSVGDDTSWVSILTYTTNGTTTYDDSPTFDNQIVYYRIGIETGDYTSGTAVLSIDYPSGGISGVFRVTDYTNSQSVSASVLVDLGSTSASSDWEEGEWSDRRGYPSSVSLYEGRLWLAGRSRIWASESDAYESFNDETEGDSATIVRTIGRGPVDIINWLLPLQRLAIGAGGAEWIARSSSFDEPLTQDNINLKDPSSQGSAKVQAVKMDSIGVFVQKSGIRLFQTDYQVEKDDFQADDLTKLIPEIFASGIVRLAVQRQPDTRLHCVLGNGRVAILVFDMLENVKCWITCSTLGYVEDAIVLPGTTEDTVYYSVKRTINGSDVRYLEAWALESECSGATYIYDGASATDIPVIVNDRVIFEDGVVVTARDADGDKIGNYTVANGVVTLGAAVTYVTLTPSLYKLADSFITYSGTSTASMTGLDHLEGESVVAFGDGKDLGTYTVSGGAITLSEAVQTCCIGLPYTARYKSVKLNTLDRSGTSIGQPKIINRLGLVMIDSHNRGLRYGPDFDNLDDLPLVEDYTEVIDDVIWDEYGNEYFEFDGAWSSDSRICLESASPLPCNLLALIVGINTKEKNSRDEP